MKGHLVVIAGSDRLPGELVGGECLLRLSLPPWAIKLAIAARWLGLPAAACASLALLFVKREAFPNG